MLQNAPIRITKFRIDIDVDQAARNRSQRQRYAYIHVRNVKYVTDMCAGSA